MSDTIVFDRLDALEIDYKVSTHEAVATVAAAEKVWTDIEGMHCKNLFLRDKKGKQHYLLVAEKDTQIVLKDLAKRLDDRENLSFASPKRMDKYLKLKPGSVSPFGIINDVDKHVIVWVDDTIKKAKWVNFHPNINTATITLSLQDFERFLEASGNTFSYINLTI